MLWCCKVFVRSFVTRASQVRGVCQLGACGVSCRTVVLSALVCLGVVSVYVQRGQVFSFLFFPRWCFFGEIVYVLVGDDLWISNI